MSYSGASTWIDAFPWLASIESSRSLFDWNSLLVDSQPADATLRLETLADLATEHFRLWTFTELFPYAPGGQHLIELRLSNRAFNCLRRAGISQVKELLDLSTSDVFQIWTMGAISVQEILVALGKLNVRYAEDNYFPHELDAQVGNAPPTGAIDLGHHFQEAIGVLANWNAIRNQPSEPILVFENVGAVPDDVLAAQAVLAQYSAETVLGAAIAQHTIKHVLDRLWESLDARQKRALEARLFQSPPVTLDALGEEFGVTRERARQIESKGKAIVSGWLDSRGALAAYSAAVRNAVSGVTRLSRVLDQLPQLIELVTDSEHPAWFVLDKLDEGFESDGEWIAVPSLDHISNELRVRFDQVSVASGVVSMDAIQQATGDWLGLTREDLHDLMRANGYRPIADHFVDPTLKSLPDLAAAYLQISGRAETAQHILKQVAPDRSVGSLQNAMALDDRFVRVDVKEWGLREWGVREYVSIKSAIAEVIARDGQSRLDALVTNLTADYNVSPRSIAAYANSWPFVTIGGIVRLAEQPKAARRSLSQTKNLYKLLDGCAIRIALTTEHLRGSGFAMPVGLAAAIGLTQGQKMSLWDTGIAEDLHIGWTAFQPAFGSIRKHILPFDCAIGDEVFIEIRGDQVRFRKLEEQAGTPAQAISQLLGLDTDREPTSESVAGALGLATNSSWASSIHVLRDRGESDVAELIVQLIGHNPAFDVNPKVARTSKFAVVSIDDPEY